MMRARTLLLLLSVPLSSAGHGQDRHVRLGDRAFGNLLFPEAIAHYEEAARAGAPDDAFASKLARSYFNVRDLAHAREWFARSTVLPGAPAQDLLDYANMLRASGELQEADHWMQQYGAMVPGDGRSRRLIGSVNYVPRLRDGMKRRCDVKCLAINSCDADMGASYLGGRVVFASGRSGTGSGATWNGEPFLDLYTADMAPDGSLASPTTLSAFNTRFHESNATFNKAGTEAWFNRNDFHGKHKGFNRSGEMEMKVYSRRLVDGAWTDEQPFAHNDQGSVCHPSLSPEGTILFFASDRPGGHGGSDIWYAQRNEQGQWSAPVCLGDEVNTEGEEMFPFLSAQGELYFASDGHAGLGGLDILRCPFTNGGTTGPASNPGAPLNSAYDDFALVLSPDGLRGYLSSNRPGGRGSDDLYSLTFNAPAVGARGIARDRLSNVLLPGTRMLLLDDKGQALDSTVTDTAGSYTIALQRGKLQELVVSFPGYRTLHFTLETPADADTLYAIDPPMAFLRNVGLWMHVTDSYTSEGIDNVEVMVTDVPNGNTRLINDHTDGSGDYRHILKDVSIRDSLVYRVKLTRVGYYPKKGLFLYVIPDSGEIAMHHALDITMEPIQVGSDASKALELAPILFEIDRWEIGRQAMVELDKVVALLKENPLMAMELRGHTDSRGNSRGNRELSAKRARSAAKYIIGAGVAAGRVGAKGYGESAILNQCADGIRCTEEEHQLNRRTEFIITKM